MRRIKRLILLLCTTLPLLGGTCTVNIRDALVSGAMDFASGTTTEVMGSMLAQVLGAEGP